MTRGHANVSAKFAERDGDVVKRGGARRIETPRHPGKGNAIETLDDVAQNDTSAEDVGEDVEGARDAAIAHIMERCRESLSPEIPSGLSVYTVLSTLVVSLTSSLIL